MKESVRRWVLPLSMLLGALLPHTMAQLSVITPYLIFFMLLFTFTKVSLRTLRFTRIHYILLLVQWGIGVGSYLLLQPFFSTTVAAGVALCVLAPTATAAAVTTKLLGGDVNTTTSYCILSNLSVALFLPLFFSAVATGDGSVSLISTSVGICSEVFPLLFLPLLVITLVQKLLPKVHRVLLKGQMLSFYIWALALALVMGKTVLFIQAQPADSMHETLLMALFALVVCLLQFLLGRRLGRRMGNDYGNAVAGAQSLGQKNTVLAIWMAQTYLNPLSSVAAASYVVWQNVVNSWQLWRIAKPKG